jgi:phage I-like protein
MKPEPILRAKAIQFVDFPQVGSSDTHNVQLLKTGKFYHPEYGEINITPKYLESMVQNFSDKVRGVDLAIDYAHDSESIAAGWIENLYLQDNELWAKVRWTKNGNQIVTDKEFRYLSADFNNNYINNETKKEYGPTLFGAGLTNRPFVKGMSPVLELSDKPIKKEPNMDEKDKQIAELTSQLADMKKQIETGNASANEMADLKKKLAAFEASTQAAEKEKALSEKKAAFDALMTAGKAVEAQRPHYMSGDTLKFAEAFVATNSGKGSSTEPPPEAVEPKDKKEAIDKVISLSEKMLEEKKAKTIGEAQNRVLRENPELNKKIYG